jgi:hypothetical protein
MKVQLKPEFHIVETLGTFSVISKKDGERVDGWLALYDPPSSRRPDGEVLVCYSDKIGMTCTKTLTKKNWEMTAHKFLTAKGWPSPWQVVR